MKMRISIEDQTFEVEIGDLQARPIIVHVDGEEFQVTPEDAARSATAAPAEKPVPAAAPKPAPAAKPAAAPAADGAPVVSAPIPGVIQTVRVKAGDKVQAGQELFILEAMKMKNSIKATRPGTVSAVHVNAGDTVTHGQALLTWSD